MMISSALSPLVKGFLAQDRACRLCNLSSSLINDHSDIWLSLTMRYVKAGNMDVLHPISASGKCIEESPMSERSRCSNLGRYAIRHSWLSSIDGLEERSSNLRFCRTFTGLSEMEIPLDLR